MTALNSNLAWIGREIILPLFSSKSFITASLSLAFAAVVGSKHISTKIMLVFAEWAGNVIPRRYDLFCLVSLDK